MENSDQGRGMRICFCITGQVRGNLDNIRQLVPDLCAHDVTYIVQVWNRRGTAPPKNIVRRRTSMADEVGLLAGPYAVTTGTIEEIYVFLEERHAQSGADDVVRPDEFDFLPADKRHVEIKSLAELEASLPPLPTPIEEIDNSIKMWYLIDKADQKRRDLEEESGTAFDIVIRMRPDTLFARNLDTVLERVADDLANGILYADCLFHEMYEGKPVSLVGDQVIVARPDIMDICTSYYREWRLPKFLTNERCHAHYTLWRFLEGEKHLQIKPLPFFHRLTATSTRLSLVTLAPQFDIGFVREQLATFTAQPGAPAGELSTLLAFNARIDAAEDRPDLEALLDSLSAHRFHADNRFGANWLRARILRKLALPQQAFELYCAEFNDVSDRNGEKVFRDILLREGSFTLAECEDSRPDALRTWLTDDLWFAAGCTLLSAGHRPMAIEMFLSCLERGQHTESVYERLIFVYIRSSQWEKAFDHARSCVDRGIFTPAIQTLAAQACDALGRPLEEITRSDKAPTPIVARA